MIKHTQIICWLYFSLWNIFDGSSARIISLVELSIDSLSDKIPIYYKWHYEWHFQNKEHHIWVKVFKNGPSKICGRKPAKFWSDTVCLSRPYHFKFFKGCVLQLLHDSFLNTLTYMSACKLHHVYKHRQSVSYHHYHLFQLLLVFCTILEENKFKWVHWHNDVVLSLTLTLNIFHTFSYYFYDWLWAGKCLLGKCLFCEKVKLNLSQN